MPREAKSIDVIAVGFVRSVSRACSPLAKLAIFNELVDSLRADGFAMGQLLELLESQSKAVPPLSGAGGPTPDRVRDAVVVQVDASRSEVAAPALQLVRGGGRHPADDFVDDPTRGWRS